MSKRRVVITGIGALTGFGRGRDLLVDSVFAGKSCIRRLDRFDPTPYACQIGAQVAIPENAGELFKNPRDAKRLEGNVVQAVVATKEAVADSGLEITADNAARIGCLIGSGIGGLITLQEEIYKAHEKGGHRVSPLFIANAIANMPAGIAAVETGAMGPCYSAVSACASSGHSIGEAFRTILYNTADVMICGGSERAITEVGLGGFASMKAVTADFNDTPERGSRPFDKNRSGFVMGEGAGVLIIEELEHAKARGAKIYAEIVGYGASADAHHLTAPHPEGLGAMLAIRGALTDGGIPPEAVGYINAHGTSTPLNDAAETKAIRGVFGAHADKLLVSSTKSMHGHLLGGAAAVESISTVFAFLRNEAPPTINYETPDPECDLNYVPNKAQPFTGEYALCNTFGFGGQNAVLLFKRYQ
jgi:3-oxoacyl-[acyl-carrier-protein] synthase II